MKLTKLITTLALAVGFTTAAWAATPVAVWDGDFTDTEKNGYTLTAGTGNTVAADGSTITIGDSATVGVKVAGSDDKKIYTILVKARGYAPTSESNPEVIAAVLNGDASFVGLGSKSDKKGWYLWNNAAWGTDKVTTSAIINDTGSHKYTVSYNYDATGSLTQGTTLYFDNLMLTSNGGLRGDKCKICSSATIGGPQGTGASLTVAKGLVIEGIAIFDSAASSATAAKYVFPSEIVKTGAIWGNVGNATEGGITTSALVDANRANQTTFTVNFGETTNIPQTGIGGSGTVRITKLRWAARNGTVEDKYKPDSLVISQGSLTMTSTDFAAGTETMTVYKQDGTSAGTRPAFDFTFAGDVAFDTSADLTFTFKKNGSNFAAGCSLFKETGAENPKLKWDGATAGYTPIVEITGTYTPDAKRTISINFGSSSGEVSGTYGIVPSSVWNNYSEGTYSAGKTATASDGSVVTVKWWSNSAGYKDSDATDAALKGYLDDGACGDGKTSYGAHIAVTGIPFSYYDVIVYYSTETSSRQFNPAAFKKWTSQTVCGDEADSCDGTMRLARNDTSLKFGASKTKTAVVGTNVSYSKRGFSFADLDIKAGSNSNNARGGIAAIQIVECSPHTSEMYYNRLSDGGTVTIPADTYGKITTALPITATQCAENKTLTLSGSSAEIGGNARYIIGQSTNLRTHSFSGWFRCDGLDAEKTLYAAIANKGAYGGYKVTVDANGAIKVGQCNYYDYRTDSTVLTSANGVIEADKWYYITVAVTSTKPDDAKATARVYVNGSEIAFPTGTFATNLNGGSSCIELSVGAGVSAAGLYADFSALADEDVIQSLAVNDKYVAYSATDYTLEMTKDENSSTATWSPTKTGDFGPYDTIAVSDTAEDPVTLTFDEDVAVKAISATSEAGKELTFAAGSGKTVSAGSYDFSGANGKVTVGFGTGTSGVAAGADTVLSERGTGTLTIGTDLQATVPGWSGSLLSGAGTIVYNAASASTAVEPGAFASGFTGNIKLTKGTWTCSSDYPQTLPVTLSGADATFILNKQDGMGYSSGLPTFTVENGATFQANARDTFNRVLVLNNGNFVCLKDNNNSGRTFDFYGSAALTVSGTSTIGGVTPATTSNSGILAIRRSGFTVTVAEGGELQCYSAWSKEASGGGNFIKDGAGKFVQYRDSSCALPFVVNGGTLKFVNGGRTTTAGITLNENTTLELSATGDGSYTLANVIAGAGCIEKLDSGTYVLTGANTYTGGTTVSAGTLEVTTPNGSYTIGEGGTFKTMQDISAGGEFAKPTIAANAGSVVLQVTMSKAAIQAETKVAIATLDASITETTGFTATVINAETGNETESVLSIEGTTLYVTPQGAKQSHVFTPTESGDFTWQTGVEIGGKSYRDYDDITFATTTFETTVNVGSKVAAETVTVGGKYAFTNSTVIATTVQTTTGADATFENDVIADSVIVTNGTVMAKEIVASDVAVTNATFGSKVVGPSMKYVRLTITETQTSGNAPAVGEFRLYRGSATTGYTIVDWPKGTKVTEAYGDPATVNQTATKESEDYPCAVGTSNESQPGCLIDGYYGNSGTATPYGKPSGYSTCGYNKWWMNSKSGPWTVTVEFPDPVATFSGCNFCLADHAPRNPTAWTIEVSSDGETWTTVNETTNATWDAQYAWKGGDENVPGFLNSGTTPTDVKVGTGSTIVADGSWTAALEVGGNVTFKGVAGKYLTLDAASSSKFDDGAALTFDLSDYGVTTAGKQYVIAGPTEGWPETSAITVTPAGKFDLYKDGEGYYVLVRSGNYWIGDQADGVGTWDVSETMAWGADAETADKSVWLNGVAAFFTRNGTVTIDADADIQPAAINVTSNDGITVTFKGAIEKIASVPFNVGSTNVTVAVDNDAEAAFNPTVTLVEGAETKFVKKGDGELTLNTAAFTNIVVEAGTLKIGSGISLSGKQIEVKSGATLDPNGQSIAGATIAMTKGGKLTLTDVPTLTGTKIVITDADTLEEGKNYELMTWTNWTTPDLLGYGMPTLELTGFAGKTENVRLVPGVYSLTLQYRSDAQVARKPLVIMPIGDSITEGLNTAALGNGKNYRIPLYNKLSLAGYNVKSVGFWKHNGSALNGSYDPSGTVITDADWIYHCGKGSMRAGALNSGNGAVCDAWANDLDIAGNPDAVLLHIGINDMLNNVNGHDDSDGTKTYVYLTNIVMRAVLSHPETTFIISSPMCNEYGHTNQKAEYEGDGKADCNKTFVTPVHTMMTNFFAKARAGEIEGLSAEAAKKIYFADLYQNVMPRWYGNDPDTFINDGSDHCHPNWLGHELMAQTWFDQITNAFPNAENTDGNYDANPAEVTEFGAEKNVPQEYREGYVLARRFVPTATQRLTYNADVPYAYTNETIDLDQCVGKVAYFFEYVRPTVTTNLHRYVWADMDAFGATLENVGVPTKAKNQKVVNNLHIYGNHPAVWNIDANDNTQKGFVEFWPNGYNGNASGVEGAPAHWFTYDWNDSAGSTMNYGSMQVHRMIDGGDMGRPAQVVFAYNGFTSETANYQNYEFGIGNFAQSFNSASMDWTFMRATETMSSANLSYRAIEIWVKVAPTSPLTAEVTGETDFSKITWTDAKGVTWPNLTGAYDYVLTGTGTTTLDATLASGATVTVAGGTLKLTDAEKLGTPTYTVNAGATLLVTASGLTASKVTNNGTIRFEGGTAEAPIAITGDGDFGATTLAKNTYVKNTVTNNRKHIVTGEDSTSSYALNRTDAGVGFNDDTAFTNLTLVSACENGRIWIERMTLEDVRFVANKTIHLNGVSPTILSLKGTNSVTRAGSETLTIIPEAACEYAGESSVPFVIGGTELVTLSGAYTGALTVNAGASVKLTGSAVPSSVTGAGTVTFDYGADTTKTVSLASTGAVNVNSGTVIFSDYRGAVTLAEGAKVGYTVNVNDCGSFTVPAGVDVAKVELYRADGTKVDATLTDRTFTFDWEITDSACWWDYEFNGNVTSTGTDTGTMTQEGTEPFYNAESNALWVGHSTHWRDATYPYEFTAVLQGKIVNTAKHAEIGFGSSTKGTKISVAIVCGENVADEEVKLIVSQGSEVKKTVTMNVPNAYTADHLYAFVVKTIDDGGTEKTKVIVYLDGTEWDSYTFSGKYILGGGFQIGSVHGGIPGGYTKATTVNENSFLNFLRVYKTVLSNEALAKYAAAYPYKSQNGNATRTFTDALDQTWVAAEADKVWSVTPYEGDAYTTNVPPASAMLTIDATADATVTMNLDEAATYEQLTVQGERAITLKAGGSVKPTVAGLTTVGANLTIEGEALGLGNVTVSEGKTLTFDFTEYPFDQIFADKTIQLTGKPSGAGTYTAIIPELSGRTATFGLDQYGHYVLTITVEQHPFIFTIAQGEEGVWSWNGAEIDEPDWTQLSSGAIEKMGDGVAALAPAAGFTYDVKEGTLKFTAAATADCLVTNVAAGATLDINGIECGGENIAIGFVVTLNGGTLANTSETQGIVKGLTLLADSTVAVTAGNIWIQSGSGGYSSVTLALGDHTLTKAGDGQFGVVTTTVTGEGMIDIAAGELWVQEGSGFGDAVVKVGANGTFHVRSGKTATVANVTGVAGGILNNEGTITAFTLTGTLTLTGKGTWGTVTLDGDITCDTGCKRGLALAGNGTVNVTLTDAEIAAEGPITVFTAESEDIVCGTVKDKDGNAVSGTFKGGTVTVDHAAKIGTKFYLTLSAAFDAAQDGETVTLLKDIDFGSSSATEVKSNVTLDMQNHTVQGAAGYVVLMHTQDHPTAALRVVNGTIANTGAGYAIYQVFGTLTLSNATVRAASVQAIYEYFSTRIVAEEDSANTIETLTETENASAIYSYKGAVTVTGTGALAILATKTTSGIYATTTVTNDNANLSVEATTYAIAAMDTAGVTLSGGKFKGSVYATSGDVTGGIFSSKGNATLWTAADHSFVANTDEDTKTDYPYAVMANVDIVATISNGDVNVPYETVQAAVDAATAEQTISVTQASDETITIPAEKAVTFSLAGEGYLDDASIVLGAKASVTCALAIPTPTTVDGYAVAKSGNTYTSTKADVKVGTTYYLTLADAINATTTVAGDTVELLADMALDATLTVNKAITLDLGNKTVTLADAQFGIVIDADATVQNGSIASALAANRTSSFAVYVNPGKSPTLKDLAIDASYYEYGLACDSAHTSKNLATAYETAPTSTVTCQNVDVTGNGALIYAQWCNVTLDADCSAITNGLAFFANEAHRAAVYSALNARVTITGGTYAHEKALLSGNLGAKIFVNGGDFDGKVYSWMESAAHDDLEQYADYKAVFQLNAGTFTGPIAFKEETDAARELDVFTKGEAVALDAPEGYEWKDNVLVKKSTQPEPAPGSDVKVDPVPGADNTYVVTPTGESKDVVIQGVKDGDTLIVNGTNVDSIAVNDKTGVTIKVMNGANEVDITGAVYGWDEKPVLKTSMFKTADADATYTFSTELDPDKVGLTITNITVGANALIDVTSFTGLSYQLLRCTDLSAATLQFDPIGTPEVATGTGMTLTDGEKPDVPAFYKAQATK